MVEQNIFVYHGHDREGRILAALMRHCDTDQSFRFLPVDNPQRMERMHRFLRTNGMNPDAVQLPFVITLHPGGGGPDAEVRSVLHGHAMWTWLNGVVDALTAQGVNPADLRDGVVLPHLSVPTMRLLAYALPPPPPPAPVVVVAPPPPIVEDTPPPPMPPSPPDTHDDDDGDDEDVDGGDPRQNRGLMVDGEMGNGRTSVPMKQFKRDKAANELMSDAQQQIKARERMQTRVRY